MLLGLLVVGWSGCHANRNEHFERCSLDRAVLTRAKNFVCVITVFKSMTITVEETFYEEKGRVHEEFYEENGKVHEKKYEQNVKIHEEFYEEKLEIHKHTEKSKNEQEYMGKTHFPIKSVL